MQACTSQENEAAVKYKRLLDKSNDAEMLGGVGVAYCFVLSSKGVSVWCPVKCMGAGGQSRRVATGGATSVPASALRLALIGRGMSQEGGYCVLDFCLLSFLFCFALLFLYQNLHTYRLSCFLWCGFGCCFGS